MEFARLPLRDICRQLLDIAQRHPEFRIKDRIKAMESGRRDTHNREGATGETDLLPENRGVRRKTPLPQTMTDHNDLVLLLCGKKSASMGHGKLSNVEKIGGYRLSPDPLRFAKAADGSG